MFIQLFRVKCACGLQIQGGVLAAKVCIVCEHVCIGLGMLSGSREVYVHSTETMCVSPVTNLFPISACLSPPYPTTAW